MTLPHTHTPTSDIEAACVRRESGAGRSIGGWGKQPRGPSAAAQQKDGDGRDGEGGSSGVVASSSTSTNSIVVRYVIAWWDNGRRARGWNGKGNWW